MKTKKYVFWYEDCSVVFNLYARNLKHLFKLLDDMSMDKPICVEDCYSEIWWKE